MDLLSLVSFKLKRSIGKKPIQVNFFLFNVSLRLTDIYMMFSSPVPSNIYLIFNLNPSILSMDCIPSLSNVSMSPIPSLSNISVMSSPILANVPVIFSLNPSIFSGLRSKSVQCLFEPHSKIVQYLCDALSNPIHSKTVLCLNEPPCKQVDNIHNVCLNSSSIVLPRRISLKSCYSCLFSLTKTRNSSRISDKKSKVNFYLIIIS